MQMMNFLATLDDGTHEPDDSVLRRLNIGRHGAQVSTAELAHLLRAELTAGRDGPSVVVGGRSKGLQFSHALARRPHSRLPPRVAAQKNPEPWVACGASCGRRGASWSGSEPRSRLKPPSGSWTRRRRPVRSQSAAPGRRRCARWLRRGPSVRPPGASPPGAGVRPASRHGGSALRHRLPPGGAVRPRRRPGQPPAVRGGSPARGGVRPARGAGRGHGAGAGEGAAAVAGGGAAHTGGGAARQRGALPPGIVRPSPCPSPSSPPRSPSWADGRRHRRERGSAEGSAPPRCWPPALPPAAP